jgi:hypothetical protein
MAEGLCPAGLKIMAAIEQAQGWGLSIIRRSLGVRWMAVAEMWVPSRLASDTGVCALGAFVLTQQPAGPWSNSRKSHRRCESVMADLLGVHYCWLWGFMAGFDGMPGLLADPQRELIVEEYDAGRAVGRAIAAEVFREGP